MAQTQWNNLNKLESFKKLQTLKGTVSLKNVLKGAAGAKRVASFNIPMGAGLNYNYAAKSVDRNIIASFKQIVKEAQLLEKFAELYNGAVINNRSNSKILR